MIIVVNAFAFVSVLLYTFHKITLWAFMTGILLWFVLMISFWFILPGIVYRRNETFRDEFTMNFEQNGFSLRHERGSREWRWEALSNFVESPNFFHLYFDARSFFLVPKSGFKDKDEVFEMRQLLKQKVRKL